MIKRTTHNPSLAAMTVSRVQSRPLEIFFKKSKNDTPDATKTKPASTTFLGGLMRKAHVGPNRLMELEPKQDVSNASRALANNSGRNGNCSNYSTVQDNAEGTKSGRTIVKNSKSTDKQHVQWSNNQSNQLSQPSTKSLDCRQIITLPTNIECRKDITRRQRSPSVSNNTNKQSTSPRLRTRKPQPIPQLRLPSPGARQQPNLNHKQWQCQIRQSEKPDVDGRQQEYAVKPTRQFPLPIKPVTQCVNHVHESGEQNLARKTGTWKRPVHPSSSKVGQKSKLLSSGKALVRNAPVQDYSRPPAPHGSEKNEGVHNLKTPTVSDHVPNTMLNDRRFTGSKTVPNNHLRCNKTTPQQHQNGSKVSRTVSEKKITSPVLQSVPAKKSLSSPSTKPLDIPTHHQNSSELFPGRKSVGVATRQRNNAQEISVQVRVEEDKKAPENDVQEAVLSEKNLVRPIKKRRIECLTQSDYRIEGITDFASTASTGKQEIPELNFAELRNRSKSHPARIGKETNSPSPACITRAEFGVPKAISLKRTTPTFRWNAVRRGLLCEMGHKKDLKHPCWIANTRNEHKTRVALEAVRLRADCVPPVRDEKSISQSNSHCDWTVTFHGQRR